MSIQTINPATGSVVDSYKAETPQGVEEKIDKAHKAFTRWRRRSFEERATYVEKAAQVLTENIDTYAALMSQEMGKPVSEARSEVEKCAWVCRYYATHAEEFLESEHIETDARTSFVSFQPLGVVLAVMPWNFPFWQVFRFAAPALMAGNAAVLKHASNVPGCALAIEAVFREAGLPSDLFQTLLIGSGEVEAVIEHSKVRAVTLTGSGPAGRAVAQKAGAMLKKTVLELGGSDPFIVLEDANLEKAVEAGVTSRLINSGQSCIAAKRFVVEESVRERFEELFVARMEKVVMGDPMNEATEIGPQARRDLRDELHEQVVQSVEKGAVCRLGGSVPEGDGAFYPPTVLTNVGPGMPAFREELFGPVAAVIPVQDADEAIAVANDSRFGLGAVVFTEDLARGQQIAAEELEAGCCFVNSFVKSDPRLPFGGIKDSGYGRELSHYGIKEFTNAKTVYVA